MAHTHPLLVLALACSLAGGCGPAAGNDPDPKEEPQDAGTADDAGPDAGAEPDAGVSQDAGPDAGTAGSALVTAAEGGLVVSEDGLLQIFVSPGAVEGDTTITITRVDDTDVPADLAAAGPLSAVYSVEPDGLVFSGDGAWAHFSFPTIPPALVSGTPARYTGMTGLSRSGAGGAIETSTFSMTWFDVGAGRADVVTRLAHLSFQTVIDGGVTVAADLGTPRHAVGERWSAKDVTLSATSTLFDESGAAAAELERMKMFAFEGDAVVPDLADAVLAVDTVPDAALTALGLRHVAPQEVVLGAGTPGTDPRVFTPASVPSYVCTRVGTGSASLGANAVWATIDTGVPVAAGGTTLVQSVDCVAAPAIRATVSETTTCRREGDTVNCSDPPVATAEVEVLSPITTWVATPFGNFIVTTPEDATPAVGPDTIVATTDAGASMTATRDPATGEYDEVFADAPAFTFDGDTVTFDSGTDLFEVPLATDDWALGFGPVEGLDTDLVLVPGEFTDTSSVIVDVRVSFRDPFECAGARVGVSVEGWFDAGGTLMVDHPLRDLYEDIATHCGVPVEEVEALPAIVSFEALTDAFTAAVEETPGGRTRYAVVSDAIAIDPLSLTATCPLDQTFCTDACVDTATDPDNCGGCGLAPIEVCDTIDNNCDGEIDEGCPRSILWGGATSLMTTFGGTDPGDSGGSASCAYPAFLAGACGNVDNTTGNIRSFRPICATTTLVTPTAGTPDEYAIQTTTSACGTSGGGPSGGTPFTLECPPNTFLDGFDGLQDPYIGSLSARCSTYDVQRGGDGTWAIVRTGSSQTVSAGSGPGTPFTWVLTESMTTGFPGAVRIVDLRYDVAAVASITLMAVYATWPSLGY